MSKHLLVITSSVRGDESVSNKLVEEFVTKWQEKNEGQITRRNIGEELIPHLHKSTFRGLESKESKEQKLPESAEKTKALSEELIKEIKAATQIVMGVPMYNFSIPSQLKSYFDHVVRSGVTFGYGTDGQSVGLLSDKPTLIITTGAGNHADSSRDFQKPYLVWILNFIGIKDVQFVRAHNFYSPDGESIMKNASQAIQNYVEAKPLAFSPSLEKSPPVKAYTNNYKLMALGGLFAVAAVSCKLVTFSTSSTLAPK